MRQKGFTVVELIIVIVVIGILASITIVGYNGFQNRANDTTVRSDLEAIAGELEAYRTRNDPSNPSHEYPRTKEVLETLDIYATKSAYDTSLQYNMTYCVPNNGAEAYQAFKLIATSKSGAIFMMTQDGFKSHSLTSTNINGSLCVSEGMSLISNGMYNINTWYPWVKSN